MSGKCLTVALYQQEDKLFSCVYYHKAIVHEGLLEGDRYQFIALHENIVINNCVLYSRDSGLKLGTETHGDIRNVILSDCVIKD